jgi:hypothetical protein
MLPGVMCRKRHTGLPMAAIGIGLSGLISNPIIVMALLCFAQIGVSSVPAMFRPLPVMAGALGVRIAPRTDTHPRRRVLTGSTAGLAAGLPTHETAGLPVSPVHAQLVGTANVQEEGPVPTSALTPVQLSVQTLGTK